MIGYALAVFLLFGSYYVNWLFVLFPLWVLLLSIYILLEKSSTAKRITAKQRNENALAQDNSSHFHTLSEDCR